jgi:hypothetical protein
MKKMVVISALVAVLVAAMPAQAMFSRMSKAFSSAAMRRGLSTGSSSTDSMCAKIAIVSALFGSGCGAGYGIQAMRGVAKQDAIKEDPSYQHFTKKEIKNRCKESIVYSRQNLLYRHTQYYKDLYNQAFVYCSKTIPTETLYTGVIDTAQKMADLNNNEYGQNSRVKYLNTVSKFQSKLDRYRKYKQDRNALFMHYSV